MSAADLGEVKRTFDIFVGGPMGSDEQDGAGLLLKVHLKNLLKAVDSIAQNLNKELRDRYDLDYDLVSVNGPPETGPGEIPHRVFELLDEADLGIFDMSGAVYETKDGRVVWSRASPNVVYEYAILHGLGVPTLPVALKQHPVEFYFNQANRIVVDRFDVPQLKKMLKQPIRLAVRGADNDSIRLNPVSKYYDNIPLVDMSSTTGLALGYYFNFLSNILNVNDCILKKKDSGLDRLAIIKPIRIADVSEIRGELIREVEALGMSFETLQEDKDHVKMRRPMTFSRVGRYIVDILTPLAAMPISDRYKRSRILAGAIKSFGGNAAERRLAKYDTDIIENFVKNINKKIGGEPAVHKGLHEVFTLPEFIERLKSEQSTGRA